LKRTHVRFRQIKSYGWKWENAPINWYESYFANYLKLNNYDIRIQPFYFLYGGIVTADFMLKTGELSYYWSSTAYDADNDYNLYFHLANIYPSANAYRFNGFSIRCLAR